MNPSHIELDIQSLVVGAASPARASVSDTSPPHHLAELYTNVPLPTQQSIRVLDLSPSPGDAHAPLRGVLRTIDLATSPRFTALSYVWGAPAPPGTEPTISCNNDYIVPITQNCHDVLVALRNHHSDNANGLTIWVDAICINQQDDREKGVQLPLMGTIYTFAEAVFVWLGNGTPGAHRTVSWLNHATRRLPGLPGNPWLCGPKEMVTVRGDILRESWRWIPLKVRHFTSLRGPHGDNLFAKWIPGISAPVPEVTDVQELLNNEWLERVWTFQEIILASNPILVCGPESITWSRFQTGLLLPKDMKKNKRESRRALVRAAFELSEERENHEGIADWLDLLPWWQLFELWATAYRPLAWNGVALRKLADRRADGEKWSARGYRMDKVDRRFVSGLSALWILVVLLLVGIPILAGLFIGMIRTHLAFGVVGVILALCFAHAYSWYFFWACGLFRRFKKAKPFTWFRSVGSQSLVSVLQVLRERQAGDPKDRAYALYGVLANMGVEKLTQPDYAKLLGEVYHGFFLDLIEWKPSLIALLVDAGPALPGAPSWVPDWSAIRDRGWVPSEIVYMEASPRRTYYSEIQYALSEDRRAISLRGAIVGRVTVGFGPFQPTGCSLSGDRDLQEMDLETFPNLWAGLDEISCWITEVRKGAPVSSAYDSVPLAILRVLDSDVFDKPDEEAAVFNQLYRLMVECEDGPRESFTQRLLVALLGNQDALTAAISFVDRLAGKRNLFYSRDGHIGTGPPGMVEGDHFVVLEGVPYPMMLRTSQSEDGVDWYTVVGPAFVPGYFHASEREVWNKKTGKWEHYFANAGFPANPMHAALNWDHLWIF